MSTSRQARRPNLFILGAPRCGTTAMFEFLGAHPEIFPARIKEPNFFVPGNERPLEEYLELFAGATDERWLLEASASHYMMTPDAPSLIREFSPDARAIVIVRDPVEQLRSLHDLRVFLRWHRSRDFVTDLAEDGAFYWKQVRSGENLQRVLNTFRREDVHTVVYDDFEQSNASVYSRVLEFLEVDSSFAPQFHKVNASFKPRNELIQQALWGRGGTLRAVSRIVLPERARKRGFSVASRLNRRTALPLDPDLARSLWLKLEADVELLSALLGRDLVSLWRR